jgi:hypothetical protein
MEQLWVLIKDKMKYYKLEYTKVLQGRIIDASNKVLVLQFLF